MQQKSGNVFLSYAMSDHDVVHKIGRELSEAGWKVWDPAQNILPGSDWTSELKSALDSAGALVVFISPEAIASRDVSYEIEYALGAKHLRGRLIPVTISPAKNVPWILNRLHQVLYESPTKTGRQIAKLLDQPNDASDEKSWAH